MTQPNLTRSWVVSANGHRDFPLQNLPLGVFSVNGSAPRSGVAIGEQILDLHAALECFEGEARRAVEATAGGQLNAFFELGRGPRVALRERLLELLAEGSEQQGKLQAALRPAADCQMHLPARIKSPDAHLARSAGDDLVGRPPAGVAGEVLVVLVGCPSQPALDERDVVAIAVRAPSLLAQFACQAAVPWSSADTGKRRLVRL